jgi:transcriptional regulator with XRE-family HTH domain
VTEVGKSPAQIAGELLRAFRDEAELSQAELAQMSHCSQPTISGLERGSATGTPTTIKSIDEALKAKGKIIKFWAVADFGEQSAEKLAMLEAQAIKIHDYEGRVIPGLIQTPDYARAVMRAALPLASVERIENDLAERIKRQEILALDGPLMAWFIVDESVLYRPFGGKEVMREQLVKLEGTASRPGRFIQVVRFSAVNHPGSAGPLRLMEFSAHDSIWYTEGASSGKLTDDKDEVRDRMSYFDLIRASALSPEQSIRFIEKIRSSRYE